MIPEIVNGVEYTYVRIVPKKGVIRGGVPIGKDIVYPPTAEPLSKKEYAGRGVDFVSREKDGDKNIDYYKGMLDAHEESKKWHRVVSVDTKTGENNRKTIAFYKEHAGLEEKDSAKIKEYYEKKEKDKK